MLTPEDEVESFLEEAARIYGETGDTTMVEDSGLHPRLPRRTWHYAGREFHVVRESENEVYLGLSPNPPKDTDGRREDSGRGWVRELQGRWPGVLG